MIEVLLVCLMSILVVFAGAQFYAVQMERKRAIDRERELLAAVLSKNIGEYIQAIDNLKRTSKDKLAEMKIENELAMAAARLEDGRGVPVS